MIREKRKKKSRWKLILLAILSLMLVVVISALLVVKVFVVKTVKVEGNVLYDEALIKSTVLNDVYSWNSLYVLLKYTFLNTEQLPFIDTMEIQMENPQTLKIKVYEKGMMGYLYIPASLWVYALACSVFSSQMRQSRIFSELKRKCGFT